MTGLKNILVVLIAIITGGLFAWSQEKTTTKPEPKLSSSELRTQAMIENTHILYGGSDKNDKAPKDSLSHLLNLFYYDQFRHFQDPRAPYFMFLSKNSDLAFGVGGKVNIRGYYDWNGSIPDFGFVPYEIPIPKDPTSLRALKATPNGTGLFFTLLGNNPKIGKFMAYFQASFSATHTLDFTIKKAYVTIGDWTAGYHKSTFEDTMAEPVTVDSEGPNGINSRTNILVRYMHSFKKHWTIAASVEFPKQSISADEQYTAACTPYVPDFDAFAQYQWDEGQSHLRLSGMIRTLTYRDLIRKRNFNVTGWGVQLSTVVNITGDFTFFGILSTGAGHASYTTDLGNGNFDLIPDTDRPGRLYAPMAAGLVAGLQYYFSPKLFCNLAFSEQTYYPKHNPNDSQYKYGLYAVGNIFWDITPRFELGLEYLHGKRKNFNGESGSANRVMAMINVSF